MGAASHIRAGWQTARETASETWADFRARSRYYQAKAWIIIAYAGVVVATLFIAPPRVHNDIDAVITIAEDQLFGPYILVENKSGEPWSQVRYTLNERFTIPGKQYRRLEADGRVQLQLDKFRTRMYSKRKKRTIWVKPRAEMVLRRLEIATNQGAAAFDLSRMTVVR